MGYIGIDILSARRFEEIAARSGDAFIIKVFTKAEIQVGENSERGMAFFAGTFAAKEAVFKLFCRNWQEDESFLDIEILRGSCGEPIVNLYGGFKRQLGYSKYVTVSISYEDDMVVAAAMISDMEMYPISNR